MSRRAGRCWPGKNRRWLARHAAFRVGPGQWCGRICGPLRARQRVWSQARRSEPRALDRYRRGVRLEPNGRRHGASTYGVNACRLARVVAVSNNVGTWFSYDAHGRVTGRTTTYPTGDEVEAERLWALDHPLLPRTPEERDQREALRLAEDTHPVVFAEDPT